MKEKCFGLNKKYFEIVFEPQTNFGLPLLESSGKRLAKWTVIANRGKKCFFGPAVYSRGKFCTLCTSYEGALLVGASCKGLGTSLGRTLPAHPFMHSSNTLSLLAPVTPLYPRIFLTLLIHLLRGLLIFLTTISSLFTFLFMWSHLVLSIITGTPLRTPTNPQIRSSFYQFSML